MAGPPIKCADRLNGRFGDGSGIIVRDGDESWTSITIDQARTPLSDVLNFMMTDFSVDDVRIVEISMENVVQRIYDGALQ